MKKEDKNLYLEILEWAYNNSVDGFTEDKLLKNFNLIGVEKQQWYEKMFRNSGHGNVVLIDHFFVRENISYWALSPKGMSEAIYYLNLKEAQKTGKRSELIALFAIGVSVISMIFQIFKDTCFK